MSNTFNLSSPANLTQQSSWTEFSQYLKVLTHNAYPSGKLCITFSPSLELGRVTAEIGGYGTKTLKNNAYLVSATSENELKGLLIDLFEKERLAQVGGLLDHTLSNLPQVDMDSSMTFEQIVAGAQNGSLGSTEMPISEDPILFRIKALVPNIGAPLSDEVLSSKLEHKELIELLEQAQNLANAARQQYGLSDEGFNQKRAVIKDARKLILQRLTAVLKNDAFEQSHRGTELPPDQIL